MKQDLLILWRLFKLLRPYAGWVLLGVLLSLATVLANISLLTLSGWFITAMALAGIASVDMNYFTPAATIRGLAIARTGGRYLERLVTHEATFRITAQLRYWFYEKLEPLAPAALQHYHSGDLLRRIRSDIDTLESFYLRTFSPIMVALIAGIIVLLFLSRYHLQLMLVELVLLVVAGLIVPLIANKFSKKPGEELVEKSAVLQTQVIDSIQGMGELQIYQADARLTETLSQQSESVLEAQTSLNRVSGMAQGSTLFFANLAMWLMVIVAIPLLATSQLEPAQLPMLALLALASFEMIMPLPLALQALPQTLTAAKRIFAIIDTPVQVSEPASPKAIPEDFTLEFDKVSFAYPEQSKSTLENFSLRIEQGQKVGIVGPSGAGKSTIIALLMRFWDPQQGQITLGDDALTAYDSEELRKQFAVASQQVHLFNSTVKRNLLLANPEAADEQIVEVCKIAEIHDFIESQEEGYDTWIGEAGTRLSGGQIQRLAIARALLKDAPILILDEPGENLDAETELRVMQNILEASVGRTVILITHKKVGLEAMDQLVSLN